MNNLTVLEIKEVLGQEFIVYGDIQEPLFLAKDVAEMIDNKNVSQMLNAVDEDEKALYTIYRVDGSTHKQWFLTEDGLYEVLMQSRKPIAKQFKKEVKAILKQLRQTGVVITESATNEAIDFESKYGIRRIRKTFRETTDVIKQWEEFKELSKIERDAHRIDNKDRIKRAEIIIDELQDYIANNALQMKPYELPMYQGVMLDIRHTSQKWTNKMYGGKLSNKTREVNNLRQQNQEWQEYSQELESYSRELEQQVEELTPPERIWTTIDYHGFSCNYMYQYTNTGVHTTPAYSRWQSYFPHGEIPAKEDYEMFEGIDFDPNTSTGVGIEIQYVCKDEFDAHNLDKAFIDQLFLRHFGIDDSIVKKVDSYKVGSCSSYDEGKIIFSIYNL